MRVVVNDVNILMDLIDVGLLDLFFQLEFEMNVADSVVSEFENEDDIKRLNMFTKKGKIKQYHYHQHLIG